MPRELGPDSLPLELAARVDRACDAFEAAWRDGRRPRVEDHLAVAPEADRPALLGPLLIAELEGRRAAGEAPDPTEYHARFPGLAAAVDAAFAAAGPPPVTLAGLTLRLVEPDRPARPPFALPDYEVLAELGRGGMGVVYKARHRRLNRVVAVKTLHAGSAAPEAITRLLAEAEAVARLRHPHIIQVHGIGDCDGRPFLEMEYVPGGSLADRLDGRPRPPRAAADLVEALARALHEAHRLGVVHRDVKPANVLVAEDGTPKLTDFGLAKLLGDSDNPAAVTRSGALLGTPSYMAPEQAAGRTREVGPATDVHALGALLYELTTGRRPFPGPSVADALEQVRSSEPPRPRSVAPGVPRDLETICLKCLEKDPRRRYDSAAALAEDLRRFLDGEVIQARPSGVAERAWRWCLRRPALAAMGAAVALLLAVIAVGAPLAALSWRHQRDLARDAARDATEKLWRSYLNEAHATRLGGREGRRTEALDLLARAAAIRPSGELRDEAIACLAVADLRVQREWEGLPVLNTGINFDPELARYARSDARGTVSVRRVADDAELLSLPAPEPPAPATALSFSPDGRHLAAIHAGRGYERLLHRVWDLADRRLALDLPTDLPGAASGFSPDGRLVAVGRPGRALEIYELATGGRVGGFSATPDLADIAFHPLGRLVALSSAADRVVQVRDVQTGAVAASLPHPTGAVGLAWSPDGATLASGGGDHRIRLWDVATSRLRIALEGHRAPVTRLSFRPSGEGLISGGWDGATRLWDTASGTSLVTATGVPLRLDAGGRRLAYYSAPRVGIREVADGDAFRRLRPERAAAEDAGPARVLGVDVDPEGRLLATAGNEGVRLWDLATSREVAHLPLAGSGAVLFDERGRSLITDGAPGLKIWPIRPESEGTAAAIRLGPPVEVPRPADRSDTPFACLSLAGSWLTAAHRPRQPAIVLELGRPDDCRPIPDRPGVDAVALSPDARWIALGGRGEPGIRIRERETGRLVTTLPGGVEGASGVRLAFSPDGGSLITGLQADYRCWRAGTWQLLWTSDRGRLHERPGPVAFAADGRLAAITPTSDMVRLVDAATGRAVAALESPEPEGVHALCFAPDGGRLAVATDGRAVAIWDLRRLRRHLAEMGLDWDLPPLPPPAAGEGGGGGEPIVVRVSEGESS
ncbi:serine/threonine-protein kinase [Aquisphaera giovannonii]|nr:serine/threonine-protein kinase [Aquisphaera giovannonii]